MTKGDPMIDVKTVSDTTAVPGPLAMSITIRLHRTPRQKCANCGERRVCFFVGLSDVISSPAMCARCAGVRPAPVKRAPKPVLNQVPMFD